MGILFIQILKRKIYLIFKYAEYSGGYNSCYSGWFDSLLFGFYKCKK